MAIDVVCPGCRKRFKVSDQYAGKKGPCPQCKAVITVPEKGAEVVVHAPEHGPKDARGKAVLKPLTRKEAKLSPVVGLGIGGSLLLVFALAYLLGASYYDSETGVAHVPTMLLGFGALVLAPPLALGGYTFLRNDELEPHRGIELGIRTAVCGLVYAGLWGIYFAVVKQYLFGGEELEVVHLVYIVPPFVLAGGFAAFASLELDFGSGLVHYGMYLLLTVLLRLVMGLPAF